MRFPPGRPPLLCRVIIYLASQKLLRWLRRDRLALAVCLFGLAGCAWGGVTGWKVREDSLISVCSKDRIYKQSESTRGYGSRYSLNKHRRSWCAEIVAGKVHNHPCAVLSPYERSMVTNASLNDTIEGSIFGVMRNTKIQAIKNSMNSLLDVSGAQVKQIPLLAWLLWEDSLRHEIDPLRYGVWSDWNRGVRIRLLAQVHEFLGWVRMPEKHWKPDSASLNADGRGRSNIFPEHSDGQSSAVLIKYQGAGKRQFEGYPRTLCGFKLLGASISRTLGGISTLSCGLRLNNGLTKNLAVLNDARLHGLELPIHGLPLLPSVVNVRRCCEEGGSREKRDHMVGVGAEQPRVSWPCYVSDTLEARPNSTHGYVDLGVGCGLVIVGLFCCVNRRRKVFMGMLLLILAFVFIQKGLALLDPETSVPARSDSQPVAKSPSPAAPVRLTRPSGPSGASA